MQIPSPIRRTGFAWFLVARLVSLFGSFMAPVALAFAVLETTGSPSELGVLLAAQVLPRLLLLIVGGAVADRWPRRRVLVAAHLGSAAVQGVAALVLLTDHYSLMVMVVLQCGVGTCGGLTGPALRGMVPELVDPQQIRQANSMLSTGMQSARLLGPGTAGFLVAGTSPGWAVAVDAVSFAVAACCLTRLPRVSKTHRPRRTRGSLRSDIADGWRYFWTVRWLWPVSMGFLAVNLVQAGPWQILGPTVVGVAAGAAVWGLILTARAVGMLAAGLALYRWPLRRALWMTTTGGATSALPLLTLGWTTSTAVLVGAAIVGGFGSASASISWDTALHNEIPAHRLSRVAALDDLLSYAAIPIGQLATGPLAVAFGPQRVCLLAGIGWLLTALAPLGLRDVRGLRLRG